MSRLHYAGLTGSIGTGGLTSSATSHTFTVALTYANGVTVPTLTGSDYFLLTILNTAGSALSEVVQVTAYNSSTGAATLVRGQEGTSGVSHSSGDAVTMAVYASDFTPTGATAYHLAVLADSPAVFWEFDEPSGIVAADSSGNGHAGTYYSPTLAQTSLASDGAGYSASFNGTNGMVDIAGASWMGTPGPITVEARIKWDGSSQQFIAGRWGGAGSTGWLLYVTTGGKLTVQIDSGSAITGVTTLSSSSPTTVGLRCNGSTADLFVNGVLDKSSSSAWPTQVFNLRVAQASNATYSTLRIDGLALFTCALSDARMAAHHAAA